MSSMETLGILERSIPKNLGKLDISFFCFDKHLAAYAYYKTRKKQGHHREAVGDFCGFPMSFALREMQLLADRLDL
jgi:hypothetical protein